MRTFIIAVFVTFALGGSALANNIDNVAISTLVGGGAIAASNVPDPYGSAYQASNAIDNTSNTQWNAVELSTLA